MYYRTNFHSFIIAAVLYALFAPAPAHAYLDAGTGSYLLQVALASLAGGLFVFKTFWRWLRSVANRKLKRWRTDSSLQDKDSAADSTKPSDHI